VFVTAGGAADDDGDFRFTLVRVAFDVGDCGGLEVFLETDVSLMGIDVPGADVEVLRGSGGAGTAYSSRSKRTNAAARPIRAKKARSTKMPG
jgi:hypothetical protein